MVKVSIIVPVYNVEKYLAECIDSLLAQDFDALEIICVEDCSTDDSLKILREYARRNKQISIICHSNNMGLSVARNTGLEVARGKYVLFVDSDDVLEKNAVKLLYETAENYLTDVVYFDNIKIYQDQFQNNKKNLFLKPNGSDNSVCSGRSFFYSMIEKKHVIVEAWRQFFRRDFLIDYNITFLMGIIHEDILFSFYVAMEAERTYYLEKELYYYRQREGSISAVKNQKRAQSIFVVLSNIFVYWKTHSFTQTEALFIEKFFRQLFEANQVYLCYGKREETLLVGDEADKTLYHLLFSANEKKWLETERIPLEYVRSFNSVCVFGAGQAAKQVIDFLRDHNILVDSIIVSDKSQNADEFCGIKVQDARGDINMLRKSVVIIGVTSKNVEGIREQLENAGIRNIIELPDAK